jgi:hypothetical protein
MHGPSSSPHGHHEELPRLRPRAMPERLVMTRHGESEINVINRALKHGAISEYPQEVLATPDREFRLSPQG